MKIDLNLKLKPNKKLTKPLFKDFKIKDTDKDKVYDVFDCQPRNRRYQERKDWMKPTAPKPQVEQVEGKDWMDTKRYRRRPKIEKEPVMEYEFEARRRYSNEEIPMDIYISYTIMEYFLGTKGMKPSSFRSDIKKSDIKIYPYRKDTLEVYDRKRRVYHWVDVSNIKTEEPLVLFSITAEDRARTDNRRIMKRISAG
jgi:hypothetical protein